MICWQRRKVSLKSYTWSIFSWEMGSIAAILWHWRAGTPCVLLDLINGYTGNPGQDGSTMCCNGVLRFAAQLLLMFCAKRAENCTSSWHQTYPWFNSHVQPFVYFKLEIIDTFSTFTFCTLSFGNAFSSTKVYLQQRARLPHSSCNVVYNTHDTATLCNDLLHILICITFPKSFH